MVSIYGPGSGGKRWTVMAAAGVVLLTQPWHGGIDPVGFAFAVAAGACWGSYILLTQHVGDRVTGLSGAGRLDPGSRRFRHARRPGRRRAIGAGPGDLA
jgi:hypothetical protein